MRSAGEDGGFERVFIKRHTNTIRVAEKRSTAAYYVSYWAWPDLSLLYVLFDPR